MTLRNTVKAEHAIRDKEERVTRARTAVLAVLFGAGRSLTHLEIASRLEEGGVSIDRVTVYRVLEWLTRYHLAHKVAGDDRIWRFSADSGEHPASQHAHFQCTACGKLYCLQEMAMAFAVNLPSGYRSQQIELNIKGSCAQCNRG